MLYYQGVNFQANPVSLFGLFLTILLPIKKPAYFVTFSIFQAYFASFSCVCVSAHFDLSCKFKFDRSNVFAIFHTS